MPRGPIFMLDTMWTGAGGPPNPTLLARDAYIEMMQTAQNVADRYATREEIDAFALRSHQHAAAARYSGRLAKEIHPVEFPATRKEPARVFEHDESILGGHERREARGAASAGEHDPNDGRQLLAAQRRRECGRSGQSRAGRGTGHRAAGAGRLLRHPRTRSAGDGDRTGLRIAESAPAGWPRSESISDVWEVHEAYASVAVAICARAAEPARRLRGPHERLNPNGGAVAIGHPFGSSGTRYVLTLSTELRERGARYGVLGVCVGSGQGVALVLENPSA